MAIKWVVTPRTSFLLAPTIKVADRTFSDAWVHGVDQYTLTGVLAKSSNVGTITLAQQLGEARLSQWIKRFGFGAKTGIDFPGETQGIVPALERWSGSTIGTLPIGHGIAVTPVQMAAAYAAVANGGVWVQPHLELGARAQRKPERTPLGLAERRVIVEAIVGAVVVGAPIHAHLPAAARIPRSSFS